MAQPLGASEDTRDGSIGRLVARNTLYLTVAQALTIPLSILLNAVTARYLGAEDFGYIYLASTLAGFGFLIVDWGHQGALPALIARDRTRSGVVLGTSLIWRSVMSIVAYGVLAAGAYLLGYGVAFQWALGLVFLNSVLTSVVAACKDTIRGFERTDIPSYVHVGQQLLLVALVVSVLVLGGGMRGALLAGVAAGLLTLFPLWRTLRPVGVGELAYDRGAMRALFVEGTPFVFFGLAMTLVPNIDAVYLSKLAPPDVMGWYAASRRLIGVLLLPSSALMGALYPTLCRLWTTDKESFNSTTSGSLRGTALVVVPVALGCVLYPDIGISIFSRKAFGPAQENLQILAPFLFLVYFSMPIGTALLAAGRQRIWTLVQGVCVLISFALDPFFVRWFQKRMGNGGAGLCVTTVLSELFVVIAGIVLMPRGIFDRRLGRSILLALLSGVAMAAVAFITRPVVGPFFSAPVAVVAYVIALWLTGGIEKEQIAQVREFVGRKMSRFRRSA